MGGIGVFGGSFNPVHQAHLVVAETVGEALDLERVLFVPAARQPLKESGELAPAADRLEMLRLATAKNPRFETSSLELERGGTSYTVETLAQLGTADPGTRLFLILGADAFALLDRWRGKEDIRRLARLVLVSRSGRSPELEPGGDEPGQAVRARPDADDLRVRVPALEISGSDIRARVRRGASIRYLVPEAVRRYIEERGLYRE